jgi:hypothetical protein
VLLVSPGLTAVLGLAGRGATGFGAWLQLENDKRFLSFSHAGNTQTLNGMPQSKTSSYNLIFRNS